MVGSRGKCRWSIVDHNGTSCPCSCLAHPISLWVPSGSGRQLGKAWRGEAKYEVDTSRAQFNVPGLRSTDCLPQRAHESSQAWSVPGAVACKRKPAVGRRGYGIGTRGGIFHIVETPLIGTFFRVRASGVSQMSFGKKGARKSINQCSRHHNG
jgi:hypothetical protein